MTNVNYDDPSYDTAIAIIGMSGRFPGARNVQELWQNIAAGVKSIHHFSDAELRAAGVDPALLYHPRYVKAGTIIEDMDQFDAAFFGYTPREAETMDPQHRLFLECAWEALESATHIDDGGRQMVGVFAGSAFCNYLMNNLATRPDILDLVGKVQIVVGNDRDSLTSTVSYKLNLKGPSVAVQTACSTSLVAVHLACQSLLSYECDLALAGGVAFNIPQESGYLCEEGGITSPDGECYTFDARAHGSVMGSGVGAVALKRFRDAVADGDYLYALIRGSAVNNDGSIRAGFTAPALDGQAAVIAEALANAGVEASTLQYIEAHGTATPLGDAVEMAAMIKAFGKSTQKKQFCAIGSVKPNIGHPDRASGVTGLIKTTQALMHRQLPPHLNFRQTNPDIDLSNSPFYVNTQLGPWPETATPRRAGVSSFGMGGTNAHVILEEAPTFVTSPSSNTCHLLLLSARTETALQQVAARLAVYLQEHADVSLADVAYTLQVGRRTFDHRRALLCRDRDDAIEQLQMAATSQETLSKPAQGEQENADKARWMEIGRRWLAGETIDWHTLYTHEKRQRLPLPTYPFERRRYWVEPRPHQLSALLHHPQQAVPSKKDPDSANWFYIPDWGKASLPASDQHTALAEAAFPYLVFVDALDPENLGQQLASHLARNQHPVIYVQPGDRWEQHNEHEFSINPASAADYVTLLGLLKQQNRMPRSIIHCWSLQSLSAMTTHELTPEHFRACLERGLYSLLYLVQAVGNQDPMRLIVMTNNIQRVTGKEQLLAEHGPIQGACRVIAQEYLNVNCRIIDLDDADLTVAAQAQLLEHLTTELALHTSEPVVAYRQGERWLPLYRQMRLEAAESDRQASTRLRLAFESSYSSRSGVEGDGQASIRLRPAGVYLLTGGFGGIGKVLSSYLARTLQARLVMVSHGTFPERNDWSAYLQAHAPTDKTVLDIEHVQQLETLGAEVLVLQADIGDVNQVQALIDRVYERFGELHGVFHIAGVSALEAFGVLQNADVMQCEYHFVPKVYGTLALARVLQGREIDFCLLFSSLSSILGGIAGCGYAAANAFIDAFIDAHVQATGASWQCVNWDSWQIKENPHGILGATIAEYAMTPEEGIAACLRVLAHPELVRVVNSTGDLHARIRQWVYLESLHSHHMHNDAADQSDRSSKVLAPTGSYGERVAHVFEKVLGVEQVGLHESFFELGGNSLTGIQLLAQLDKEFGVQLPMMELFETPTVSAIASYIQAASETPAREFSTSRVSR